MASAGAPQARAAVLRGLNKQIARSVVHWEKECSKRKTVSYCTTTITTGLDQRGTVALRINK
jgi:hypothetical protein